MKDYKFFCFNGDVKFLKVDFDRTTSHSANYYTTDWQLLPFGETLCPPKPDKFIPKPSSLDKMINLASTLSKEFPFVRVDFYNIYNKIYFGEITLYPASGIGVFNPSDYDLLIGEMLDISIRHPQVHTVNTLRNGNSNSGGGYLIDYVIFTYYEHSKFYSQCS